MDSSDLKEEYEDEEGFNSGSESVYDSSSGDDEESFYDELLGKPRSVPVTPTPLELIRHDQDLVFQQLLASQVSHVTDSKDDLFPPQPIRSLFEESADQMDSTIADTTLPQPTPSVIRPLPRTAPSSPQNRPAIKSEIPTTPSGMFPTSSFHSISPLSSYSSEHSPAPAVTPGTSQPISTAVSLSSFDVPLTSSSSMTNITRKRRAGRPPSRSWRRGRPASSALNSQARSRTNSSHPASAMERISTIPSNESSSPQSSVMHSTFPSPMPPLPSTPSTFSLGWVENESANPPRPIPFTGQPRHYLEDPLSPSSVLSQFLDDTFWENLVVQTNLYADQERQVSGETASSRSCVREWRPTTVAEMKAFMGMVLGMGLDKKPMLLHYWSRKSIYASSFWKGLMSRDRFFAILKFLHLNDNDQWVPHGQAGHNPLHKVQPLVDLLQEKFRSLYYPEKALSLDEGTCPFKGNVRFRSYMQKKPKRWGIKLYQLCESNSGYCVAFKVATGRVDNQSENTTHAVVMHLMRNYLGVGHEVYTDRYYTSPKLFAELHKKKAIGVGTCRVDRIGLPRVIVQQRLVEGQVVSARKGPLLALKWKGRREVLMLSTKHINDTKCVQVHGAGGLREKVKPVAVQDYNDNMAGVDKSDQMLSYYSFERKTRKWWKKLFFHLFNLTVVNAHKLYTMAAQNDHNLKRLSLLEYIEELAYSLTSAAQTSSSSDHVAVTAAARLSRRHFPKLNSSANGRPHVQRSCHVCSMKDRTRRLEEGAGSNSRVRKYTQYHCPVCDVFLHVDPCFRLYHTVEQYDK